MNIEIEYVSLAKRILMRFIRAFVLGGLASILVVQPLQGLDPTSLDTFFVSLVNGFVFGGLMAVEKLVREYRK